MKKAKDIMAKNPVFIKEDTPLKEAARLLYAKGLSGIPVIGRENKVVGYISEKDLIVAAHPDRLSLNDSEVMSLKQLAPMIRRLSTAGAPQVKEHMNETLYAVRESTPFNDILDLMVTKNLKRLPVLDKHKHLIGTIERSTLSKISHEQQ